MAAVTSNPTGMPAGKARTLRSLLALQSLALLLPLFALGAALLLVHVAHERLKLEMVAQSDAWRSLRAVDALLVDRLAWLRRVAMVGDTPDACLDALPQGGDALLALHAADGRVLRDARPQGQALGAAAGDAARAAAAAARPVSRLVEDAAAGGHAVLLVQPAPCWTDMPGGFLSLGVPAEALRGALEAGGARFTERQFPALVDAEGVIAARWQDHDRFVGRAMPPEARRAILDASDGLWRGRSAAGANVTVAHAVSGFSGLAVGIGILQEDLGSPLRRSLLALAPGLLAVVALWLTSTALAARRIGRPIESLRDAALALADRRAPPQLDTGVAEVNAVGEALAEAAERRDAAERQRDLLVRELHHRVKNLLATAQSLATLSARTTQDPAGFAAQFGDRLRALARTHTLLLEEPGVTAPLSLLLDSVLSPYRGGGIGRVRLEGPAVMLPAETAVALGLVLHELATNAAKYGALSVPEGRVRVTWSLPAPSRLAITWTESGGPAVEAPPTREGFGSQLLRRALAGAAGEVATEWRRDGVAVRIGLTLRP
ncbi:sensor histidine kinase [Falsiroseomonas sp. CW058]|uniref:sensor histidine kinase n=1 Tax=Falsiroseomonas sp. CW058 TaxID=3388664 RepID=UPI003D3141C5